MNIDRNMSMERDEGDWQGVQLVNFIPPFLCDDNFIIWCRSSCSIYASMTESHGVLLYGRS